MRFERTEQEFIPNGKVIRDAILEGVNAANVRYEKWSNGWWLTDSGVVGLVVATIAEKLDSVLTVDESLAMELPFSYIQECSAAKRRPGRPPKTLRGKSPADIVLFDGQDYPVCVIEVKRLWGRVGCFRDLARIRDLVLQCGVQHDGPLKRGFLALMLAKKPTANMHAGKKVEIQAEGVEKTIRETFDSKRLTVRCRLGRVRRFPKRYQSLHDQPEWAHASFCIELSRNTESA